MGNQNRTSDYSPESRADFRQKAYNLARELAERYPDDPTFAELLAAMEQEAAEAQSQNPPGTLPTHPE